MYLNDDMLITLKNYIGKFALFSEMRQTMMISAMALGYIYAAAKAVKMAFAFSGSAFTRMSMSLVARGWA